MADQKKIKLRKGEKEFDLAFCFCNPGEYRITNRPFFASKNFSVELSRGYWLQEITVSLGLYEFVFDKPYVEQGIYYGNDIKGVDLDLFPWFGIGFTEVEQFLTRLNQIISANNLAIKVDLPSIAEWEHGLLCGKDETWSWGHDDSQLEHYAWYKDNSKDKIHLSMQKKPNDWGLYDMYGNVYEYCYDVMMNKEGTFSLDPFIKEPSDKDALPCMGGCYESFLPDCQEVCFISYHNRYIEPVGFRLIVRDVVV